MFHPNCEGQRSLSSVRMSTGLEDITCDVGNSLAATLTEVAHRSPLCIITSSTLCMRKKGDFNNPAGEIFKRVLDSLTSGRLGCTSASPYSELKCWGPTHVEVHSQIVRGLVITDEESVCYCIFFTF